MKKETILLSSGEEGKRYCAFPSIVKHNDRILCAWKQGIGHAAAGDAAWLEMTEDGVVVSRGVIENNDGAIYQNTELIVMPDGRAVCWIDKQDSSNKRLGAVAYEFAPSGFRPIPGILADEGGAKYGYVFDGTQWNGRYYMLAMTFPELDPEKDRKTVELLSSGDCSVWRDDLCLDRVFDLHLNESTFAVIDGVMYRSYGKESSVAAVDGEMNVLRKAVYGDGCGICRIGRPKLFVRDGGLYALMRNHKSEGAAMELALLKIDTGTLDIEKYTVIDGCEPEDGYYAEPYFSGDIFSVVTYRRSGEYSSDILMLRYDWNELK